MLESGKMLFDINAKYEHIKPCEMLILSPRKAIKLQQIKPDDYGEIKACEAVQNDYQADYKQLCFQENIDKSELIRITTIHKFAQWIKRGKVTKLPKVIVIDQLHLLYKQTFADSMMYFIDWLNDNSNNIIKVGLTATAQDIYNFYSKHIKAYGFKRIDYPFPSKYKIQNAYIYDKCTAAACINIIKPIINQNYKVLCFCRSATQCYKNALAYGERAGWLVSQYCTSKVALDSKQVYLRSIMDEKLRNYIIDKEQFPQNIDILFVTSAYEVGVNITDRDGRVKCIVTDSIQPDSITQEIGRIRHNMKDFYLVCNGTNVKQKIDKYNQYIALLQKYNAAADDAQKNSILATRYGEQKKAAQLHNSISTLVRKCRDNDNKYQWYDIGVASVQAAYYHARQFNNKYKNYKYIEIMGLNVQERDQYLRSLLSSFCDRVQFVENAAAATNNNAYIAFDKIAQNYWYRWLTKEQVLQFAKECGFVNSHKQDCGVESIRKVFKKYGKYKLIVSAK